MALRTFTLTVKGEPFQVDRALSDHGFGGELVAELRFECIVRIAFVEGTYESDTAITRLNEWFTEDSGKEAPYPIGSLLYWSPGSQAPMDTYRRVGERTASESR